MVREERTIWGCDHHRPIVVERAEGGKRARCLSCGTSGPVRPDAEQAMLALGRRHGTGKSWGPNPPAPLFAVRPRR